MSLTQLCVLSRHASGAIIEVTNAQILTAHGDHRRSTKAETLGAENRRLNHIEAGLHATVGLQTNFAPQPVAS